MKLNKEYIVKTLVKYLDIPSPGGYTTKIINEAKKEFEDMGIPARLTNKGALIATFEGINDKEHKTISAHVDTLGAMVKEITTDGRLKFHKIGGGSWNAIEGENCHVITQEGKKYRGSILPRQASSHIYGEASYKTLRDGENMLVRIDEKVHTKEEVLNMGIRVGDFIYMDTRTEITENGFIKSRYIDDKSAVAIVFSICKYLRENNITPKYTTHFFLSNYEEIGHGVSAVPEKTKEFIAIDIGTVGEGQESDEYSVSIAAKDNKGPYNFELRKKLVDVAQKYNINYKVDVYNRYGSDASAVVHQGYDVNFACIGPGVDGTHHYERTHIEAIENNIKLLIKYITE
ncbi:M42 family metallopeptidase [Maledivibacter halophilus]|uniref:Putative aminopeptidase FrvX n=1 Tax=Maledivibacter halophilus TaxID=36842 RepID=A0A1T5MQJ9_9FIRM|nr:M42 family metallopeptidase [Maledivibacter halophilus]SKC90168.1 Putative aminopeptidase FrvX [Maledivibacter halophilus]